MRFRPRRRNPFLEGEGGGENIWRYPRLAKRERRVARDARDRVRLLLRFRDLSASLILSSSLSIF